MKTKTSADYWKLAFVFCIAGILIVLSLPRNTVFKYEFSQGKEWTDEDLVTPFDFPIYKTADELNTDKNEIITSYKPYFKKDETIEQQQIMAFSSAFDNQYNQKHQKEKNALVSLLKNVYKHGIYPKSNVPKEFASRMQLEIMVMSNNVASGYPMSEVFTFQTALNYIKTEFWKQFPLETSAKILSAPNIADYIDVNLTYDERATNNFRDASLADISKTKGVARAGTTLIKKGENVNANNIQTLESYKKEYLQRTNNFGSLNALFLGQILFVAMCLLLLFFTVKWFQPEIPERLQNIIFILTIIVLVVFASTQIIKKGWSIYLVPITIVPIYISTFFRARAALFSHWIVILLIAFYVPKSFEFVFLSIAAGIVSVSQFRTWYRRGQLYISIGFIFLTYSLGYLILHLLQEGTIANFDYNIFTDFLINILLILLAYQLVYVFEKAFGFLSNNTLMELSDTNRALLRELAEKAPGTFQHSMQVANLAEEVTRELGGDTLLIRVGALYHDIGKTANPQFFVENQQANGYSPHNDLPPEESAKMVINHVNDGVAIAKKYNLPNDIIDFIRTHHATSKAFYFYSKYKELHPEATDFSMFTYPGPQPFTKEQAILMMADAIEAASRSLKEITPQTINDIVESIVSMQTSNGNFANADITFKEITQAKKIFKRKLENINHSRIAYPKINASS